MELTDRLLLEEKAIETITELSYEEMCTAVGITMEDLMYEEVVKRIRAMTSRQIIELI